MIKEIVLRITRASLILIGYFALAFITNWQLTLLVLTILPVLLIGPIYIGNKAHSAQKDVTKYWDDVYGKIGDAVINVMVIKLFSRIFYAKQRSEQSVELAAKAQARVGIYWSFLEAGGNTINLILSIFVLGISIYFHLK